jgi:hypothetical protein
LALVQWSLLMSPPAQLWLEIQAESCRTKTHPSND